MKQPGPICAPGWMSMPVSVRQLGQDARQQRQANQVQLVRQPVVNQRQHAGITQHHLVHALRGGVAVVGGQHVQVQQAAQARQGAGKAAHRLVGLVFQVRWQQVGLGQQPVAKAQLVARLGGQGLQRLPQRVAHVEIFGFAAQVLRAQAQRKQHAAQLPGDLLQRVA